MQIGNATETPWYGCKPEDAAGEQQARIQGGSNEYEYYYQAFER